MRTATIAAFALALTPMLHAQRGTSGTGFDLPLRITGQRYQRRRFSQSLWHRSRRNQPEAAIDSKVDACSAE